MTTQSVARVLIAVLEQRVGEIERVLAADRRFASIVADGGGVLELVTALHHIVDAPVSYHDATGRVLVAVPGGPAVPVAAGAGTSVSVPVRVGQDVDGALVVHVPAGRLGPAGRSIVERAGAAISVRAVQARAVAAEEQRFAAITLEEITAGHAGGREAIEERAAAFGWDLSVPRAVLLAAIDPPFDRRDHQGALGVMTAAARETLGSQAIVWTRSATVAALVAPPSSAPGDRHQIAAALQSVLDDRVTEVTISIGVGRRVDGPAELPRSFDEAIRAVEVGRWVQGRHVTQLFDDLGLERLLAVCARADLVDYTDQTLGPLLRHDHVHDDAGQLVRTLEVWLATRSHAETARTTGAHHNTVRRRLDRVDALLGGVTNNPARQLECGVALHILRRHDVGGW